MFFLQKEMQKFVTKIVDLMREAKLFCWQGGPVIMLQVIWEFLYFLNLVSLYTLAIKAMMRLMLVTISRIEF